MFLAHMSFGGFNEASLRPAHALHDAILPRPAPGGHAGPHTEHGPELDNTPTHKDPLASVTATEDTTRMVMRVNGNTTIL